MITLLTILTTVACTILAGGIFILLRYTERNASQKMLVALLAVWLFIVGSLLHRVAFTDAFTTFQSSILDIRVLMRAVVGYLVLLLYIVVSIDGKFFSVKRMARILLPAIGVIALYFGWHVISGEPYDYRYGSYEEMMSQIGSATVVLRIMIALTIAIYVYLTSRFALTLIPIYQRYVWDNYADSRYNLLWIKKSGMALLCMAAAFMLYLFAHSSFTLALYCFVGIVAFVLIIDNAMDRKSIVSPEMLHLKWEGLRGWIVVDQGDEEVIDASDEEINEAFAQFEEWILSERPYYATDFSLQNVEDSFAYAQISLILKGVYLKGYNFQSYIRKCRVEEAARLMTADRNMSIKQISNRVGFSHDSSFSRAFTAVTGLSPSEYRSRN